MNVYHEARGEPIESQVAVVAVVMNRVDGGSSTSPCKVIKEPDQFSWVKKHPRIKDKVAFERCKTLVREYLAGKRKNPIGRRIYFNHVRLGKMRYSPHRPIRIGRMVYY